MKATQRHTSTHLLVHVQPRISTQCVRPPGHQLVGWGWAHICGDHDVLLELYEGRER